MSSYSHQRGISFLQTLVAILILLGVLGVIIPLFFPVHFNRGSYGGRTEALNNAKAIAGGLVAFKSDYGTYPCDETRQKLTEEGFENIPFGNDANAYLAQLVVTDIIDSEAYFYASGVKGARKGDDVKKANHLLAPGENCLAYVMAGDGKPLSDVKGHTPLIVAPLKSGGSNPTFDPGPYADKCVYGAVDGSGKIATIDKNGHALTEEDKPLFDTGPGTLFETETPVVIPPKSP